MEPDEPPAASDRPVRPRAHLLLPRRCPRRWGARDGAAHPRAGSQRPHGAAALRRRAATRRRRCRPSPLRPGSHRREPVRHHRDPRRARHRRVPGGHRARPADVGTVPWNAGAQRCARRHAATRHRQQRPLDARAHGGSHRRVAAGRSVRHHPSRALPLGAPPGHRPLGRTPGRVRVGNRRADGSGRAAGRHLDRRRTVAPGGHCLAHSAAAGATSKRSPSPAACR